MHEMALMGEIVQLIEQDAQMKKIKYVKKVELLVGTLSNVLPDALQFCVLMCTKCKQITV
ncbi:hydrogenase nickel incorporation protein HypA [Anoxybacillus sp. BCO1]|nr:hydrogenase nickel incorporation protein HypA [Anoxybacillus sp. BCO1]